MKTVSKGTTVLEANASLYQFCAVGIIKEQESAQIVSEATSYKKESAFSLPCSTPTAYSTRVLIAQNAGTDSSSITISANKWIQTVSNLTTTIRPAAGAETVTLLMVPSATDDLIMHMFNTHSLDIIIK